MGSPFREKDSRVDRHWICDLLSGGVCEQTENWLWLSIVMLGYLLPSAADGGILEARS
jgi:hypothetical protein